MSLHWAWARGGFISRDRFWSTKVSKRRIWRRTPMWMWLNVPSMVPSPMRLPTSLAVLVCLAQL
jgi:hypothetical protein